MHRKRTNTLIKSAIGVLAALLFVIVLNFSIHAVKTKEFNDATHLAVGTAENEDIEIYGRAITKNIVTMMGGDISVSSALGKGTTFEIRLSFDESKDAPQPDKQIQRVQGNDFQGKRILLVEDNDLNREITIAMLEPLGFQIDQAENGKIAIDIFERTPCGYYSLILMDIQMPVMDGLEATERIRSLSREDAKNIPVIALTANAFAEDVAKCKESGMNSHVSKPFSAEKLRAAISKFL